MNPRVSGAEVTAIADNGTVLNSTVTDSNGNYEMFVFEDSFDLVVNITEDVTLDSKNVYGGNVISDVQRGSKDINFDFSESNRVTCDVRGNTSYVYYGSSSSVTVTNPYQTVCIDDYGARNSYSIYQTVEDTTGDGLSDFNQKYNLGTDPTVNDTTGDGLSDSFQFKELGTNPAVNDSTEDGYSDKYAYNNGEISATEKNIKVKVSYMSSVTKPDFSDAKDAFDSMPIQNKYGDDGINIVFDVDESPVASTSRNLTANGDYYLNNYYNNESVYSEENASNGYYHVLIAESVDQDGVIGQTVSPATHNGILIEATDYSIYQQNNEDIVSTTVHEIGHQLGLLPTGFEDQQYVFTYEGVDSTSVSCSEYTSVMNYNCGDLTAYSDGGNFDDYEKIEQNLININPRSLGK